MRLIFGSMLGLTGLILLVIACPLLAVAAALYYFVDLGTQDWVLVNGTVTDMRSSESYDSESGTYHTTYCPSVRYATTAGETLEVDLNECSSPPAYSTGQAVEIYYNPQNPSQTVLKGGVMQLVGNVFAGVLGILGALLCLGGLGATGAAVVTAVWRTKPSGPG